MNKAIFALSILLVCVPAGFAESRFANWEIKFFSSEDAQFLLRVDKPTWRIEENYITVPATFFRRIQASDSYEKVASFPIRCRNFPYRMLITPTGERIILIDFSMSHDSKDKVVQVFDGRGKELKDLTLSDIYPKDDVAAYWEKDDREEGRWIDDAYLRADGLVVFECRDVVGHGRLHDYLFNPVSLKILFFDRMKNEPNQLTDPTLASGTPQAEPEARHP